ncbi:CTP synthetase [Hokovirus HKV1]|uniref:CTP synthase (glutamine hydrolyzing) n=1 Tax=Hokovirus HKV1 TaxID=1977638 RepID=A0A1V0SEP9_9VIRU|nr:CTP synthetase [Hokovirus HKV1]
MTKYIVITGGIISGLGKGITSSSIGLLYKSMGINVSCIKIDPYLNIDAGTMSPHEHGECYVLKDGYESDLDLGNYERFLDIELTRNNNITTGQIYNQVINNERKGLYLGKTVQIIPHITDEIKRRITNQESKPDLCIIEVGGTVGDIEISPFIEALRQLAYNDNIDMYFIHVGLVLEHDELKTKPLQNSVSTCRKLGINNDMLIIRSKNKLQQNIIDKINTHCQVKNIINNYSVNNIYYVPQILMEQNIINIINSKLMLNIKEQNLNSYLNVINYFDNIDKYPELELAIISKYSGPDSYLSLVRAIEAAAFYLHLKINISWLDAIDNDFSDDKLGEHKILNKYDGFIIPGGFGNRGIKGKLQVVKYARIMQKPILGICLGMQIMVVDIYNITNNGTSSEWEFEGDKVIDMQPNNNDIYGGNMRLGNYKVDFIDNTKIKNIYQSDYTYERHRHRYNVNNKYLQILKNNGLVISGICDDLIETIEYANDQYYIGCQYHPEYRSSFSNPNPLFTSLLKKMYENINV